MRCAHRAIGKSQSFLPLLTSSRCERTARTKDDNIITGAVDVASSCGVYTADMRNDERDVFIYSPFALSYGTKLIHARIRSSSRGCDATATATTTTEEEGERPFDTLLVSK